VTKSGEPKTTTFRLLCCLALLAAACTQSQVDPEASVTISGTLTNQAGDPVAGRKLVLAPQPGAGELLAGTLLTGLSVGTLCFADPPPEPCASFFRDADATESGAGGVFSFSIEGNEVRTFFGNARTMGVSTGLPAPPGSVEGPAILASFRVQTEQLELGAIRFWEPKLVTGSGKVEWEAAPGDYGKGSGYRLEFTSDEGSPNFTVESGSTRANYDPRVLEDSRGRFSVVAVRKGVAPGTTTEFAYRSAQAAFQGGAGVPGSRGKPCSLQSGNDPPADLPGCKATDGRLSEAAGIPDAATPAPGTPTPAEPKWVLVDMGGPVNVGLVVVRGCDCTVEGSTDGRTWAEVGDARSPDAEIKPAARSRFRYIRAGGPGKSFSGLREISVWS
jgi:hypothetical protein